VFHQAFEEHLAHHLCTENEPILEALQDTWSKYKEGKAADEPEQPSGPESCGHVDELIAADELVNAFGEGYGDMSEALAMMQDELSQSQNGFAVGVADSMAMLPLTVCAGVLPTPAAAWTLAEEFAVAGHSLLAADLSLESPTRETSKELAKLWVPCKEGGKSATEGDLGPHHRLVALVCFMWSCQHYVAFCRRQRDSSRCVFFNDLPALTAGAPREMDWSEVPELCGRCYLTPRLALYEDTRLCQNA